MIGKFVCEDSLGEELSVPANAYRETFRCLVSGTIIDRPEGVTEPFLKKWAWLLESCTELLEREARVAWSFFDPKPNKYKCG